MTATAASVVRQPIYTTLTNHKRSIKNAIEYWQNVVLLVLLAILRTQSILNISFYKSGIIFQKQYSAVVSIFKPEYDDGKSIGLLQAMSLTSHQFYVYHYTLHVAQHCYVVRGLRTVRLLSNTTKFALQEKNQLVMFPDGWATSVTWCCV